MSIHLWLFMVLLTNSFFFSSATFNMQTSTRDNLINFNKKDICPHVKPVPNLYDLLSYVEHEKCLMGFCLYNESQNNLVTNISSKKQECSKTMGFIHQP